MGVMSPYTAQAMEIIAELDEVGKSDSYFVTVKNTDRPDLVRRAVRMFAKDREWFPRLVTSVSGGVLFVKLKEVSRIQLLERALEKALMHVDDDRVYEELLEVLNGTK